jgi:hypothetical protein
MWSPTPRVEHKRRSLLDAKAVSARWKKARFPTAPTNRESERQLICKILTHDLRDTQPAPPPIHRLPSHALLNRSLHCACISRSTFHHLAYCEPLRAQLGLTGVALRSPRVVFWICLSWSHFFHAWYCLHFTERLEELGQSYCAKSPNQRTPTTLVEIWRSATTSTGFQS